MKQTIVTTAIAATLPLALHAVGQPKEAAQQENLRLAWWHDAKFDIFIHRGLYSQIGGERKGGGLSRNWRVDHVQDANSDRRITKAYLLADLQKTNLKTTQTESGVSIALPAQAPDPIASVICLEISN